LFAGAGVGWHYETGIQIIRMILAGIFDRFPNLTIVKGDEIWIGTDRRASVL
jgi:predicted TIM-barrel fold metal-dependent hydrolase